MKTKPFREKKPNFSQQATGSTPAGINGKCSLGSYSNLYYYMYIKTGYCAFTIEYFNILNVFQAVVYARCLVQFNKLWKILYKLAGIEVFERLATGES